MKSVSVVIPTLNAGTLFNDLMRALRAQSYLPLEIIVVDSGSTDGTLDIARVAGASILPVNRSEFDHGLTRNLGIAHSKGEIVVLLTQDAIPKDDHLLAHMVGAFSEPTVAGVFARQIPRPEHDILIARNLLSWITGQDECRVSHIVDMASFQQLPAFERYMLCVFDNVCSALRRSVWEEFPFNQATFGEDIEWSKRVLEAGWKTVYEPRAAVIHSHQRSVAYEYRRTYMCHRTLYRLFGLSTIPALSYVPRCFFKSTTQDWSYIMRHERRLVRKISLLLRAPALSWGSVWGQYTGARDEREGRGKKFAGV